MFRRFRWQLCSYTLALALGLSALGAGAVHLPVLIAYAVLVCVSAVLATVSWTTDGSRRSWRQTLGIYIGVILTLFCLLQALPLPQAWVSVLAPRNADIWARSQRLFDSSGSALSSLSVAPERTLVEALKVGTYTLVFAGSATLSSKLGAHFLVRIAFGLAVAVALVTAGHQVASAERLYGVYELTDAYSVAPLLNANNRAGYLNLGFFCGLGVLFRAGARPHATLIGLGLAFVAAEILLCGSVGGTGCLAIGAILVVLSPRGKARSRGSLELGRPLQAAILALVGVGATLLALSVQRSALGLDDRSIEKLDLFERVARLSLDHPWFGIGRGAFGSVFTAYQWPGTHSVFEHAENFPLQWASEWGIPMTVVALGGLGTLLVSLIHRRTHADPVRRCAFIGCIVLVLQNFVDLGLEITAVAALACLVVGAQCGSSPRAQSADSPLEERRQAPWLAWAAPVLCAVCVALVIAFGVESPSRLRRELHQRLSADSRSPSPAFWSELERAMGHYPAESYFPLLGASAALAAGRNALPFIGLALERAPVSAPAHLELALILQTYGRTSQALGALKHTIELDPQQMRTVLRLADQWRISDRELEAAVPSGAAGADFLLLLSGRATDGATRMRRLEQALELAPDHTEAHHAVAKQLWRDLTDGSADSECVQHRDDCLARAEAHVERGRSAGSPRSDILKAKLMVERGQAEEAERYLAQSCEHYPGDMSCTEEVVTLAFDNRSARLGDAVHALVAAACRNPKRCGETHLKLGHRFSRAGEWALAMGHYRRAAEETPSHVTLLALAKAAEHLEQPTLANDARRRAELLRESSSAPTSAEAIEPVDHLAPPETAAVPSAVEPSGTPNARSD